MKNRNTIKLIIESMSKDTRIHFIHFEKLLDVILSFYLFKNKPGEDEYKNERLYFINLLTQKFMLHGFSVKKLILGITLESPSQNQKIPILDPFSIYSIERTMIETYLVQNYLSNTSVNEDLLNGRFEIWMRYGLLKRGNNFIIAEAKKVLESDKENIKKLEQSIKNREFFKNLSEEKKLKFLKAYNSEWKFLFESKKFYTVSWKKLLEEAGVNPFICEETYNFLSWHSHSQSISLLQLQEMWENDYEKEAIRSSIKQLNMYIAFMISDIVRSNYNFKKAYDSLSEDYKEIIDFNNLTFRGVKYLID